MYTRLSFISCSVAAFTFCESNEETPEVPEPVDTGCPEFIIKQTLPEFVEWLSAATHTMDPSAALIFLEVVRVWVKLSNDPNSPNYVPGKLEAVDQLWLRLLDVRCLTKALLITILWSPNLQKYTVTPFLDC